LLLLLIDGCRLPLCAGDDFGAGPGGRTSMLAQLLVYEILRRRGLLQGRDVFFKASNV